jgi:hypothetical protein
MTTTASTAVVVYDPGLLDPEHVALAGFLGGYRGLTRDAYALDLRQFVAFCGRRNLKLFEVHRSDIEAFGRELEANGRATATIARRLCTITGFYRYGKEEGLIAHSPTVHVRRPRIDYESHAIGLDLGRGRCPPRRRRARPGRRARPNPETSERVHGRTSRPRKTPDLAGVSKSRHGQRGGRERRFR